MKKFVSLVLAVLIVCSLLSGCGSATEETVAKEAETTTQKAETVAETKAAKEEKTFAETETGSVLGRDIAEEEWLPLVKNGEKKTLTVGIRQLANVEDYDANALTQYIEEKTGIDLEFVYFSNDIAECYTQLNLMATGGEKLPDVMIGMMTSNMSLSNDFGENGFYIDLTDLLETEGHYFWKAYEEQDAAVKNNFFGKITDPTNGEIYAMPLVMTRMYDDLRPCATINQAWLDKVGMKAPTTIAELRDVLKAFVEKDPNGNGKADEIGMIGVGQTSIGVTADYIINAYVYYEGYEPYNATNGKVWAPFVTEEWRSAMKTLNDFYKEGLIAPGAFTIADDNEIIPYVTGEGGSLAGVSVAHPLVTFDRTSPLFLDYVPLEPLKGETDLGGYTVVVDQMYYYSNAITKDCEDPALAMRLLDFFFSDDTIRTVRFGIEGTDWTRTEGGKSSSGDDAIVTVTNSTAFSEGNQNWHRNLTGFLTNMNYSTVVGAAADEFEQHTNDNAVVYSNIIKNANLPTEKVAGLVLTSDESELKTDIGTPIRDYVMTNVALFATGEKDPYNDADWNAYLADLNTMGLDKYLEVVQAAYDRQK